jgi:amidase
MAASAASFPIEETTIATLHDAYVSGRATAVSVCQAHLDRIAAYDRSGPALGAIIIVNPDALADAASLDTTLALSGKLVGPLHGVPILVKDNFDVAGLQTTAGSAALFGWVPEADATVIAKIRAAGGIILAKTTMSEWARGGWDNINSVLPGFARNPYNTAHATGGSSGGTGSGLAASFGVVGLGSDTFGSIRNPASNNAVVGLRPSWGLVSRAGMVGLCDKRDTAGPMARTVTDLVRLLDIIAGIDPTDPATAEAANRIPPTYMASLNPHAIAGRRIGVLRQACRPDASDPQVIALFDQAVSDLQRAGAEVIDPFMVPEFDQFPPTLQPPSEERAEIERYLARTELTFPKTVADIMASRKFHPLHEVGLLAISTAPAPDEDPVVGQLEAAEARMRTAYLSAMEGLSVDALAIPTATYAPKLNGDRDVSTAGLRSGIAAALNWPAVVVPMGYTYESLPSGLQLLGQPWSEPILIELAYAYEQATRHRVPPTTLPSLRE